MKLFTWKENRERKKMESREMVRLACEAMEDKKHRTLRSLILKKFPHWRIISLSPAEATGIRYRLWRTASVKLWEEPE